MVAAFAIVVDAEVGSQPLGHIWASANMLADF